MLPQPNDCWLLVSPDPDVPRLTVRVLSVDDDGRGAVRVAPFFADADDALPADTVVDADAPFLLGEYWVASNLATTVPLNCLYKKLGALPEAVFRQAREGGAAPYIAGLGDARDTRLPEACATLAELAREPMGAKILRLGDFLRGGAVSVAKDVGVAAACACSSPLDNLLTLAGRLRDLLTPSPIPVMRGTSVKTQPLMGFRLDNGDEGALRIEAVDGGWIVNFALPAHTLVSVWCLDGAGVRHAGERLGDWWTLGDEEYPVAPGESHFFWKASAVPDADPSAARELHGVAVTLPAADK